MTMMVVEHEHPQISIRMLWWWTMTTAHCWWYDDQMIDDVWWTHCPDDTGFFCLDPQDVTMRVVRWHPQSAQTTLYCLTPLWMCWRTTMLTMSICPKLMLTNWWDGRWTKVVAINKSCCCGFELHKRDDVFEQDAAAVGHLLPIVELMRFAYCWAHHLVVVAVAQLSLS